MQILRKELDVLKSSVLKAEASAAEAGRRYEDENRKVKELQAQFRAANEVRQEAYVLWQNLRKELSKKVSVIPQLLFFSYMSLRKLHVNTHSQCHKKFSHGSDIRFDLVMLERYMHHHPLKP